MMTNEGNTIAELSTRQPIMLIFLRHFGCTFCREALSELSHKRAALEARGSKLVFVHMADMETADRYFIRYNLEGVEHVCDPDCQYYTAFGLVKGNFRQLFGLSSWIRGFQAEDGIRDAQESRGLGDVYKRQFYGVSHRIDATKFPPCKNEGEKNRQGKCYFNGSGTAPILGLESCHHGCCLLLC